MTRLRQIARLAPIAIAAAALAACATVPSQEMSDARQSLDAARDAGAARYAPAVLTHAETLLQNAASKLAEREYRQAERDASAARAAAIKARNIAVAIGTAKIMAEKAEGLGVLPPEVKALLAKADVAASAGDEQAAVLYANSASEQLRRAIRKTLPPVDQPEAPSNPHSGDG